MFGGSQRRTVCLQFQTDEDNGEGLRGLLRARDMNLLRPGFEVRRRKNGERARGRGKNEARGIADGDVVRVGIAAETLAEEIEAVGDGGSARGGGYGLRGGRKFGGGKDGAGDVRGVAGDIGGKRTGIERGDEERAAGGVGGDGFAVGEGDFDVGSEAAGEVENGERGALAGDKLAGDKKSACAGGRRRLLRRARCRQKEEAQGEGDAVGPGGADAHRGIVEEIAAVKKWAAQRRKAGPSRRKNGRDSGGDWWNGILGGRHSLG